MKRFLAIVAFWVASLACATSAAYTGPVSDTPTVRVSYLRHVINEPRQPSRIETLATANLTNPSTEARTVTLDCTKSRTTTELPPRTVTYVLLDPRDTECTLSPQ